MPYNHISICLFKSESAMVFPDYYFFAERYSSFFFFFRTLVTRVPTAERTQLASLDLHSRDIDACVRLDSKENIVKRV